MNEPTYIVEDGQVTHRVLPGKLVVHEQHPFIIALTSHIIHQIYFEADYLTWVQIRSAGEGGTLQACIDIINTVKPPPDPFLQHEL